MGSWDVCFILKHWNVKISQNGKEISALLTTLMGDQVWLELPVRIMRERSSSSDEAVMGTGTGVMAHT